MFLKHHESIAILAIPCCFCLSLLLLTGNVLAHDPIFSPGPHLLFKHGYELHVEFASSKQSDGTEKEQAVALKYGITGDWVVGFELPYQTGQNESDELAGVDQIIFSTKHRFWRKDALGVQQSAAFLLKLNLASSGDQVSTSTTDVLLGLTYGFESLKWYRWASIRYRYNQDRFIRNLGEMHRGDRFFIDFSAGYRAQLNDYRAADTVWLIELNGEFNQSNQLNGFEIADSGGNQWFVSPGIMWTLRNFAVKAGVQIPLYSNLNGAQPDSNYRARLEFEWHL